MLVQLETPVPNASDKPYQVLARKYRSQTLAELIGQDAMVRILNNAFAADRVAHAFILTGVRGVGKTSTARIIAKSLNCKGTDGNRTPTTEPCGQCQNCKDIADGRHVDVLEMDAASRTGVGDIRDIIEGVPFRPASGRYKVYIIDEVHMLSNSAFNALLKTLEEPPEHVKFIFATTEIKSVPVTVLSRCQRFDLRRVEPDVMTAHLGRIAKLEEVEVTGEALALIVRAAEGSVRDAVSLLDQAIANGTGSIKATQVREMLALADRGRILDLFDLIMKGDAAGALKELASQYTDGADPLVILRDLAEVTHWISVIKYSPGAVEDPSIGPDERERGKLMASKLPMSVLSRAWQMLLRSIEEVPFAPNSMSAAEMAIIRLACVAEFPTPESLVKRLATGGRESVGGKTNGEAAPASAQDAAPSVNGSGQKASEQENGSATYVVSTFGELKQMLDETGEFDLLAQVRHKLRIVEFRNGYIKTEFSKKARTGIMAQLQSVLRKHTGCEWQLDIVETGGMPSEMEAEDAAYRKLREEVENHDLTRSALAAFPGAKIKIKNAPQSLA